MTDKSSVKALVIALHGFGCKSVLSHVDMNLYLMDISGEDDSSDYSVLQPTWCCYALHPQSAGVF